MTRAPRATWLAVGTALAAAWAWLGLSPVAAVAVALAAVAVGGAARPFAARSSGRVAHLPAMAIAAGAGAALLGLRVMLGPAAWQPPPLPDGTGPWRAIVVSVGSPRDGSQQARLALLTADPDPEVAATLPAFPVVRTGATVEVGGRLEPPPEDDPYGEYLRRTQTAGTLQARRLVLIAAADGVTLQAARDAAGDALRIALPEPEAGLAAGVLIGLRERVDRQLAADFATAGASHVVAISGWNIAIVAGLVTAVLRGRPRRLVALGVGGTIVAYVIAAGASPSVVRAAVMAGVVLTARESGRAGRAAPALALAAALMLMAEPAMIGDAGFRLSVAATAGLLAWATPLGRWIGSLRGGRVPAWLAEGLGISLAAQAATLPDVLVTFGRLSVVAPGVNLLVVPLVPAAMAAGVVAMAGGTATMLGVPPLVATVAGLPGWLILHAIVLVIRVAAAVPFAAVAIPPEIAPLVALIPALAVIAAPSAIRAARHRRGRRRASPSHPAAVARAPGRRPGTSSRASPAGRAVLGAGIVVVAISTLAIGDVAGREARIVMLDVGQGDAILVDGGDGSRMLVDGGPDPERLLLQLDARIPPWDRRIDVIVLTHPHEDHVAGLVRVLERYRVGRVFEPGMHGPGPGWNAWNAALRGGPPRGILSTGARLRLGLVRLSVLWPDPGVPAAPAATGRGINDVSIVLLGEANGRRFLLTGDAEDDVDPRLLARGLPHLDVLKVAHHGSATATSAPLLAATRPTVALISVGARNDYGHPAPDTLGRLRDAGARVYRTDRDGTIEVDLRREGLAVRTAGPVTKAARGPARYDAAHARPEPRRRGPNLPVARSTGVVRAARVRRRGRRGMAGTSRRAARPSRGRGGGRGRGPPPRRRQGRRPAAGGAARGRLGRVARGTWLPDPRAAGPRPSRDAPRRRRRRCPPAGCNDRGPDRGLRRQARGPTPGVDGRPVRFVATAVSGGTGRSTLGGSAGAGWPASPRQARLGRRRRGTGVPARARPRARRLCGGRRRTRRGPATPLGPGGPRLGRVEPMTSPVLAYYRGGDGFALDRAVDAVVRRIEHDTGAAPDRWRVAGDETGPSQIAERVATAPMFGGGTVAVVTDPGPLLRSKDGRTALERSLAAVAPGNGLVFIEQGDAGTKRPQMLQALEAAVLKAGGEAKAFPAPKAGELAGWLRHLAQERGLVLERDASEELARRVGGFVTEGDVDRQRQGTLAAAELDKLGLYRQAAPITAADVRTLVPEVIPDSTWAMLDAVAERRAEVAGPLLDRLLETTPLPVVIVQLHRRLRELLIAADLVAQGRRPPDIVKAIGGHPFRAQKLVEQARRWTLPELDAALEGVLELDAMIKGAVDAASTERQVRLAFTLWMRDRVAPARRDR